VQKNNFEKMLMFGFFGKKRLWTPHVGGEGQYYGGWFFGYLTYLNIGVEYEFDIKQKISET
jgi:hypothetical protein